MNKSRHKNPSQIQRTDQMRKEIESGVPLETVAVKYNLKVKSLQRIIGMKSYKKMDSGKRKEFIVKELEKGRNATDIGRQLGITDVRVAQLLSDKVMNYRRSFQKDKIEEIISSTLKIESKEDLRVYDVNEYSRQSRIIKMNSGKTLHELKRERLIDKCVELYRTEKNFSEIALELCLSRKTLRTYLQERGIKTSPTKEEAAKRNEEIKALYAKGDVTYKEISQSFDITEIRVRQIVTSYNTNKNKK